MQNDHRETKGESCTIRIENERFIIVSTEVEEFHDAALDIPRAARDIRQSGGEQAAGARLGCRHPQPARREHLTDDFFQPFEAPARFSFKSRP